MPKLHSAAGLDGFNLPFKDSCFDASLVLILAGRVFFFFFLIAEIGNCSRSKLLLHGNMTAGFRAEQMGNFLVLGRFKIGRMLITCPLEGVKLRVRMGWRMLKNCT